MKQYRLERGGVEIGVVTRGEWDGHQGSWHDWGWLDPGPGTNAAIELLTAESHLQDEAVRLESAGGDPAGALAEAARLQAEFMAPGVALLSLADGARSMLIEVHTEAGRVYWR